MIDIILMILAFVFTVGILITFHEFGHYWVARRCNVKILRFSVGFGRPLWRRKMGEDGAEFVLAALPLGGYVKMLDGHESFIAPEERRRAFNNRPLGERVAIVLAGPVFNFIFAILAYWLVHIIGFTGLKPVIEGVDEGSLAMQAGFARGDEITAVNGQETATWNSVLELLIAGVIERNAARLIVKDASGHERPAELDLATISIDALAGESLLDLLGIAPSLPAVPARIGKLVKQGAADRAGLVAGDRIVSVDGTPVRDWEHWVQLVRASPNIAQSVTIDRQGKTEVVILTPEETGDEDGRPMGYVGVLPDMNFREDSALLTVESWPVHTALVEGIDKTIDMSLMTLRILGRMIIGQASVKNLSGPISIAQYAGQTAQLGIVTFLGFLALVSISLGVLNLLPIPLLDGGYLLYYLVEFFKGSPVSDSIQLACQKIGLALLFGLMSLVIYNDIIRLLE